MTKILFLLAFSIIFSACSFSSNQEIQQKKNDEIFQKNLKCQEYRKDLEERYLDTDINITAVFYSSIKNSCLYVSKIIILDEKNNYISASIKDVFTDVVYVNYDNNTLNLVQKIEDKIKEYK